MDGINKAIILGNLGADPELKMLPGGNAVLKLRVATNEVWFDKDKVKQERVEWHRVTIFGRRAEGLAKWVRKGMSVFVSGRNRTSSYEKEGQKHYSTEIIADELVVTGSPRRPTETASTTADAPFAPGHVTNGGFPSRPPAPLATDIPF